MDSLAMISKIKVAKGAAAAMRAAGEDPEAARSSNKTLMTTKVASSLSASSCAGCRRCLPSTSPS